MIVKTDFRKRDNKRLSDWVRIGFFEPERNKLYIIAEFQNWNNHAGINEGFLIINSVLIDCTIQAHQKSNMYSCGFNKSIANLEECLLNFREQYKERFKDYDLFDVDSCGCVHSYMTDLMNFFQGKYKVKLFLEVLI